MLVCGVVVVNVLFRTISASMDVIKAPMMMGGRCVYYCVMFIFVLMCCFFTRLDTERV